MKINVFGKGKVPGLNGLAPLYNKDADTNLIKRILAFRVFRVFDATTNLQITSKNIDEYVKVELEEKEAANKPQINVPKMEKVVTKPAPVEPVVEQKPFIPPVVDEKAPEIEEVVEVEATIPEPVVYDEPIVETTIEDTVEEPVAETEDTVEEVVETTDESPRRRNKKKRH
jgi:hypothetical protein